MEQGRQFKALYSSLGFSADEAAQLLHVTTRSVHNWVSGSVPVPYMALKLLRLMLRYELPGKAWEGWHLSAGRLYTPEGFELAPHEVSWWSLLVRQARMFRVLYRERYSVPVGPVEEPAIQPARQGFVRDDVVTRPVSLTGETRCLHCQKRRTQQRRGLRTDLGPK